MYSTVANGMGPGGAAGAAATGAGASTGPPAIGPRPINDGSSFSGTINPQALSGAMQNSPAGMSPNTSPRGIKRDRSPDPYGDQTPHELETEADAKARKRKSIKMNRPMGIPESPLQTAMQQGGGAVPGSDRPGPQQIMPPHTPQARAASGPGPAPQTTASQMSPTKTPTKTVIKALPTVRDHTTDQVGPGGDEYIPREYDDAGEKKVTPTGHLNDGREYRCRTFFVPNRGEKLFMLATECARVLGYRDSYLLFNKNRSLYKIIANQAEKEDLIHQEILPFSYRSRQIAIVTAKSMFRQFGSRVIVDGRRVRDDYWESKARKQGFTEEDLAGEKRPGGTKAREAAAAESSANAVLQQQMGQQTDVVYNPSGQYGVPPAPQAIQPGIMGIHGGPTPLPMINLAPDQPQMPLRDFSNISRPRQEISGPAYQDRTQTSPAQEMVTQSHNAADYSKSINSQRERGTDYLRQQWKRPHDPPTPANIAPQPGPSDNMASAQSLQSPRASHGQPPPQGMMPSQNPHMMTPQQYSQAPHQQPPIAQSPMRTMSQGSIGSNQLHGRSPSIPMGSAGMSNPYGSYPPHPQMWNQSQPSPQQHGFPSYPSQQSQQSPQMQHSPQQAPPQHRQSLSQMGGMPYPGMQSMSQGYPSSGRGLYQPDQGNQPYMHNTSAPNQGGQGWSSQQPGSGSQWGWSGQQQ